MDDNKPVDEYPVPTTPPEPQPTMPTLESIDSSHDLARDPSPQPAEPFQLPVQPLKRSKRPLVITLVVLLLLIVAGAVYYFAIYNKPQATPVALSTTTPTPKTTVSAKQVIDQIKTQKLQGTELAVTTSDATSAQTSDKTYIFMASFYQLSGKDFATDPEQAYGLGVHGSKQAATADFQTIANYLTSHDFKSAHYTYPGDSTDINPAYVNSATYLSSSVFCAIEQTDYGTSASGGSIKDNLSNVWCADLASYKTIADKLQPFFDAYTHDPSYKKSSDPLATPVLSSLKVNDGVENYKNATVSISAVGAIVGGVEGIFYQEPSKSWTFLKATQDTLYCSDLATTAIKKSFGAGTCYDTKANTEIKVSTLL